MPFRLRVIFALLMSSLMTLLMSGWVTWINVGFSDDFLAQWRLAGFSAWPPAFVIVLLIAPGVQKASQAVLEQIEGGDAHDDRR